MKTRRGLAGYFAFCFLLFTSLIAGSARLPAQISVTSASPNSAPQGTINLNVGIGGSGFKHGAKAHFFVSGTTNSGGITVNSTSFVSNTQLVANIDVAAGAVISGFDIQVQNADGRTGVGVELFAVTASNSNANTLARGNFPYDPSTLGSAPGANVNRIQSDGKLLPAACGGYNYADDSDPCQPGYRMLSEVFSTGLYFMRTLHTDDPHPTRYLVLDFTDRLNGSSCPGLDTKLLSYPGRNPAAFSPENPDPCIDWLEVRFSLDKAYAPGAAFTPVRLLIDGPDSSNKQSTGNQWNAKYELDFVNPSTITVDPANANTITVTTQAGLEQAQLWTFNQKTGKKDTLLGTYRMPFQVKVTRLP